MKRRIWSETLAYEALVEGVTLDLLSRFGLELVVAVRPWDLARLPEVLRACERRGIAFAVWPMLDDADGRWASAANAPKFSAFARELAALCPGRAVAIDLEPAIADMRALLASPFRGAFAAASRDTANMDVALSAYVALVDELHAGGARVIAAAHPLVALDATWESLLETPVSGPAFDHVSVMLYTSLVEGWSRGFLGRDDARALLAAACSATSARFGDAAGVSLGVVGVGAFGDEPTYRSPAELADDVAIARASGCDDLTLFDLGGVLARAPAEAWLQAFCNTAAAARVPARTARSRVVVSAAAVAASAARWLRHIA